MDVEKEIYEEEEEEEVEEVVGQTYAPATTIAMYIVIPVPVISTNRASCRETVQKLYVIRKKNTHIFLDPILLILL